MILTTSTSLVTETSVILSQKKAFPHTVIGSVTMSVYKESTLLVAANVKLPLLNENNQSATDFTATVVDNYAVVPVKFQELDSAIYDTWINLLMPNNNTINESLLNLKLIDEDYTSQDSRFAYASF